MEPDQSDLRRRTMPELSVLMPCLNEADNLPSVVKGLAKVCADAGIDVETLILDDASDDETMRVATELHAQYPALNIRVIHRQEPRRGYGAVVRYGMAYASGRYCTFVAADGVDPIQLIPQCIQELRAGAQLAQISRYLGSRDADTIPFKYKFYQTIFRSLMKLLLRWDIKDSTYAFKVFDRIYVTALGLHSNRFSISPEITFKVLLNGGRIVYIPGSQGIRERGVSKFIFRREGPGYGYVLLRAWLHKLGVLWF
jgi:glycosyltransferase involved in cell wall biosynthesis